MAASRRAFRFSVHSGQSALSEPANTIGQLRSAAQLLEELIPTGKTEREKHLCRELVRRYRLSADLLRRAWHEDEGQDIAEYAVMLAVILVLVIGTIRLVGSNANNAFSAVASSIQ